MSLRYVYSARYDLASAFSFCTVSVISHIELQLALWTQAVKSIAQDYNSESVGDPGKRGLQFYKISRSPSLLMTVAHFNDITLTSKGRLQMQK